MSYSLEIRDRLYRLFKKLEKKDKRMLRIINKKVQEIIQDPHHYKPLRAPLQHKRRVHVGRHFVLIFSINEKARALILEEFAHHDEAYH